MRPTAKELLTGIKEAIETIVIPDLRSPWPVATANSICALLSHLAIRVENEGQCLTEANQDMRRTIEGIADVAQSIEGDLSSGLRRALVALKTASEKTDSSDDGYASIESLTAENNELRRALIAFMEPLEALDSENACVRQMKDEAINCSKRLVERELLLLPPMAAAAVPRRD